MGQKVNPFSFRLPITKNWQSKWFGKHEFADYIAIDLAIRDSIQKEIPPQPQSQQKPKETNFSIDDISPKEVPEDVLRKLLQVDEPKVTHSE